MNLPELTPSNKLAIDRLTILNRDSLDPLPVFRDYAQRFGGDLTDDEQYSRPLYPDFFDVNYAHDTSRLQHIYLNDFDSNLEEDRERIKELTRMEFTGNTFDTVAKCSESCGQLRGNYLLGSDRTCDHCGNKVEKFLNRGEDAILWLKKPEGVKSFINIGFYITFFSNLVIGSPQICVPRYFLDSSYRKVINRQRTTATVTLRQMLDELAIESPDINSFYDNADNIVYWILAGNGRRHFKKSQEAPEYLAMYNKYKSIAFCDYVQIPNRYSTILEKSGKDIYSYPHQPATAQLYFAMAGVFKSSPVKELSENDLKKNADIIGKNLVKLAEQYRKVNNPIAMFQKPALNRKHVCSGAVPFTARSVITSQTGIINTDVLIVPWKICLNVLEHHIRGHLYRNGFTPYAASVLINRAAYEVDPIIDAYFKDMEDGHKCLVQSGRNPSIEYLSLRTFYLKVNRDLNDESIKIPIPATAAQNADFDGDNEYLVFVFDNESKAKAYGAFGHHLALDKNKPFKVGRYSAQASTNLMNINTLMAQEPLQG